MIAQTQTSVNVLSQTAATRPSVKSFTPETIARARATRLYKTKRAFMELVGNLIEGGAWGYCRATHKKLSFMLSEKLNKVLKRTAMQDLTKWFVSSGLGVITAVKHRTAKLYDLTDVGWACFYLLRKRIPKADPVKKPALRIQKTGPQSKNLIPDPDLGDLTNNIHYEEYVCISDNLEREKKTTPPKASLGRDSTKHISNAKLQTEPEAEIKRAAQAYGVAETEVAEIVRVMGQKRNLPNPARYLVGILKNKLKDNPSSITYKPETEQERLNRYAKERGCLPPDHESSPPPTHIKELLARYKRAQH